jgi:microcystin-dependent protein
MADPFTGQISIFAGTFAPRNWALCDGSIISIQEHEALFSLLGSSFGGDARTTFGLPDLRGRIPVGCGYGTGLIPWYVGEKRGVETIPLDQQTMAAHSHPLQGSTHLADSTDPTGKVLATDTGGTETPYLHAPSQLKGMSALAVSEVGESSPHENRAPFQVVNYIIALVGTFPSRN